MHKFLRYTYLYHSWLFLTPQFLLFTFFFSHLAIFYVTLYFLCPCKMPYVLPETRQRIDTWINIASTLAPWASGSISRFTAFWPFGSIQAQVNRLCSYLGMVLQALPRRPSLNSWLFCAWKVWSGFLALCFLTSISYILLLCCPPLSNPKSGLCFLRSIVSVFFWL